MIDPTRRELLQLIEELSAAWHIEDPAFLEAARKDLADWYASCRKPDDTPRTSPTLAKA
jgi:hypothetical protein